MNSDTVQQSVGGVHKPVNFFFKKSNKISSKTNNSGLVLSIFFCVQGCYFNVQVRWLFTLIYLDAWQTKNFSGKLKLFLPV